MALHSGFFVCFVKAVDESVSSKRKLLSEIKLLKTKRKNNFMAFWSPEQEEVESECDLS